MASRKAWIGAGATVCAALIVGFLGYFHRSPATTNFSGEIRTPKGEAISGAKVIAAEDQDTPESAYSDENGLFHVVLRGDVGSLKITIIANGFNAVTRDVNPHRTGPEEFVLQPSPTVMSEKHKPIPQGNVTYGPNSPIIQGNHNSVGSPDH